MSRSTLLEPILGQGLRRVNFFNGRLLSGEDLSQERQANRALDERLGRAVGAGVAYGLEVFETTGVSTPAAPVVTIESGLAINRLGQTLQLPARTDVVLIRPPETAEDPDETFHRCEPVHTGGIPTAGDGVYLLVMSPASGREGRAPVSGLGAGVADCNSRYLVEGVHFRLIKISLPDELSDPARLRNRLAHRCFGTTDPRQTDFAFHPFGPVADRYGLLDDLRPAFLTDCDVPLAALYWTATQGVRFIDRWAVRRRLMRAASVPDWPLLLGDRKLCEAEAIFQQFQDHVEDIRLTETRPTFAAPERFVFLPPVGLLPIVGEGSPAGFHAGMFFGPKASRDVAMTDANLLRSLLRESLDHEPVDVLDPEGIQLYLIHENVSTVAAGRVNQLSLVFASHTLPYRGVARFGKARWDLSRFAPVVI